jgi:hypothetical protein
MKWGADVRWQPPEEHLAQIAQMRIWLKWIAVGLVLALAAFIASSELEGPPNPCRGSNSAACSEAYSQAQHKTGEDRARENVERDLQK